MTKEANKGSAPETSRKWFREAGFGMFVHWGIYSFNAINDWIKRIRMPLAEFSAYADRFRPKRFDPDDWVRMAKNTGMKYLVFTTRHHDGFSNFDTKLSDFNSVKAAVGRDLVREVVDACRRGGLKVGLYYSLLNWQFPSSILGPQKAPADWKRMVDFTHGQVRELMTNYGKIDILWYDGTGPSLDWRSKELNAMVRRLQPHILINDRSGINQDFVTPEQKIEVPARGQLWESCMTMNNSWFCVRGDEDWKRPEDLLYVLATCAHNGGNLLLNVGPRGDGTFPPRAVKLLNNIGDWMRVHGDAIYGITPYPFDYYDQYVTTAKGRTAYVFLHPRSRPRQILTLTGIANTIISVKVMATGKRLKVTRKGERHFISLPRLSDDTVHVLAVELDSAPRGAPWGKKNTWPFRKESEVNK